MNRLIPVCVLLMVLLAGCSRAAPAPAAPASSADQPGAAAGQLGPGPTEAQWAELTGKLRYKAGVYHDKQQGLLYVTLYEPGARAEAEKAVAEVAGLSPDSVVIREAEYDPGQLNQWYGQINQPQGTIYSHVDNSVNRIRYGVTTIESRERLEAAIRKAGVPLEAVIIDLPEGALSEADPLKGCLFGERPPVTEERLAPFVLHLEPDALRPGQAFTMSVAGAREHELTRGIDAYLECWNGANWTPRYTLWSDQGDGSPSASIYSANQMINGIGFDASRPGRFVLPESLKPGWYRIRLHTSGTVDGRYQPYDLWTLVQIGR